MPLAVDASRALRSPQALAGLVEAILNASENDESDWVEWKSSLDLHEKDTQGTIARHALGMANRRPEYAARCAGGCGYIAVGAEPGNCIGVAEIDPAVLSQGMHPYLGSDGPGWGAQYVRRNGTAVLVVTVEPPRSGDRIFTLQKEFSKYQAGAVFVRRQGRTVQAGPGDIRALEDRFASAAAETAERAQRLRDLREIGTLLERIITQAQDPTNSSSWWGDRRWRCEEQNLLALLLIGLEHPLPNCHEVIGESGAKAVVAAARDAREEIKSALKDLALATATDPDGAPALRRAAGS
jgi:hypothetical protein